MGTQCDRKYGKQLKIWKRNFKCLIVAAITYFRIAAGKPILFVPKEVSKMKWSTSAMVAAQLRRIISKTKCITFTVRTEIEGFKLFEIALKITRKGSQCYLDIAWAIGKGLQVNYIAFTARIKWKRFKLSEIASTLTINWILMFVEYCMHQSWLMLKHHLGGI